MKTLTRRGSRHITVGQAPEVRAWRWSGTLLLVSALLLTILLAALPSLTLQPYFSFGRDLQHPVKLLHLLSTGHPTPQPDYFKTTYPNSYSYFAASLATLAGWTPLQALQVIPVLSLVTSALAVAWFAHSLGGRLAAAFTLLVLGAFSFEPRDNLLFGTFIDLVANSTLVPLFLWSLSRVVEEESYRWPLLAGLLLGCIIHYHFLSTTVAIIVAAILLLVLVALRRDLLGRALLRRALLLGGIAVVTGLPFSLYYPFVYLSYLLAKLHLLQSTSGGAAAVGLAVPRYADQSYEGIKPLGSLVLSQTPLFFLLAAAALLHFLWTMRARRHVRVVELIVLIWLLILLAGTLFKLFQDPARSFYLLPLPASIIIGLVTAQLLAAGRQGRDTITHTGSRLCRPLFCAVALLVILFGVVWVADILVVKGRTALWATRGDVPSLMALHSLWQGAGEPYVLADESGLWIDYYTDAHTRLLTSGPAGFGGSGSAYGSFLETLWRVYQQPCAAESLQTLATNGVGLVYIGRSPQHVVKPSYEYQDGSRFLGCAAYSLAYEEPTPDGPIRIFKVVGINP